MAASSSARASFADGLTPNQPEAEVVNPNAVDDEQSYGYPFLPESGPGQYPPGSHIPNRRDRLQPRQIESAGIECDFNYQLQCSARHASSLKCLRYRVANRCDAVFAAGSVKGDPTGW